MDIANLFKDDTDLNICKSWLCGSTDGAIWSLNDWFGKKMAAPDGMSEEEFFDKTYDFFECSLWQETIGWNHDYKIDDYGLDAIAQKMADGLNALICRVNNDPDYRKWPEFSSK